jgi:hypothetical protein
MSYDWVGDGIQLTYRLGATKICELKALCINTSLILNIPAEISSLVKVETNVLRELGIQMTRSEGFIAFTLDPQDILDLDAPEFILQFDQLFKKSKEWLDRSPTTNRYVDKRLWDYHWILYKTNRCPWPDAPNEFDFLGNRTEKAIITQRNPLDYVLLAEDLLWYRPDLSKTLLTRLFTRYMDDTGFIYNPASNQKGATIPPLWSFPILEYVKFTGDYKYLEQIYPFCKRNLEWWEKNRFFRDFQLFSVEGPINTLNAEFCTENSPRFAQQFTGKAWVKKAATEKRRMIPVDLNSQICDLYQNMGVLAMIAEDPVGQEYFHKAEDLQQIAQEFLWHQIDEFYYDYDIEMDQLQPLKSASGFWPLYGGLASKAHIQPLTAHLTNPNEFWSELPIASIAMDEKFFSKELWHGPVSLAQDLWLIHGLKRYNLNALATQVSERIFRYLNESFKLYNGIFCFYPPMSYNINSLILNNNPYYAAGFCLANAPIHSIFFRGLLGAEVLDESINFVPGDWSVLPREVSFNFYYRNRKIEAYLSKRDKKMLEIYAEPT